MAQSQYNKIVTLLNCYIAKLARLQRFTPGQLLVEILIAIGLASILLPAVLTGLVASREGKPQASQRLAATAYLREAEEAVRSVHESGWNNIAPSGAPLHPQISGSAWSLASGSETTSDGFTRTITISDVNRDNTCNIPSSGGVLDPDTKKITTVVTWPGSVLTNNVTSTTYLANPNAKPRRGMLVYGDTNDAIRYKTLNPCDGTWSGVGTAADVDGATNNKALRATKLYSSATRNEKILISRHYNGSQQFIYAQVFNGTSWGNVVLLSSWTASTFIDVQNFDGTYLANGNFMAVYSDNSTTLQFRIWNSTSWTGGTPTQNVGGIPSYIVASARPGTNEVMVATFDQSSDTNTIYYNGSIWSTAIEHSTNAPITTIRYVDFVWSPTDATKGGLTFARTGGNLNRRMHIRIFTAIGGGSWSSIDQSSPPQANEIGAISINARKGANEFTACNKDRAGAPLIICYKSNFTPTFTNPSNQTLVTGTDTGIQRSYHIGFESLSGNPAVAVYSDNTNIPKLKKYDPTVGATGTWDAAAASLNNLGATLKTVMLIPRDSISDDIMLLMANNNLDLFSQVWNGSTNTLYASPAGLAFSTHGTNGSATTDFWYDFAWDKY